MDWIKLFIICGSICGTICKNITEDKLKQLIAEKINDPNFDLTLLTDGKQDSTNSFFQWIQSLFSSSSTNELMESNATKECSECTCGKSNYRGRILGGVDTKRNQYPWMGVILDKLEVACGSTLINDRYVLTAAHCIEPYIIKNSIKRLSVRFMEHILSLGQNTILVNRKIKNTKIHPNYDNKTYKNDIVLLELSQPVVFDDILNPICFPLPGKYPHFIKGLFIGYGVTNEGMGDTEQQINLQKTFHKYCEFDPDIFCTGAVEDSTICYGDDGGGYYSFETTTVYQMIGVASLSFNCATKKQLNVFINVTNYQTWIDENTKDACKCLVPNTIPSVG